MAATNRYRGTSLSVTWTKSFPTTATAVTITGVKSMRHDPGISVKTESADGDVYPSVCFADFNDPSFAFETINPYCVSTLTSDMRGTLAFSVADAFNGTTAAGGGKSYAVTNAYLAGVGIDHMYREFGKNSVSFKTISTDGTTSPVTVTAL